jgi:hypothetical protein
MSTSAPRNLLGRLNARTPDDLQRIAAAWLIPLPGTDRARHVGVLYRGMTDIRLARSMWDRLDPAEQAIVTTLALGDPSPATIEELTARTDFDGGQARAAAVALFQGGLLAREGDAQELPIGVLPRLFLPREIGQVFRRVLDEIDAGDLSNSTMRVLLETLDDAELEEAAGVWGLSVIPGQRRRSDLVAQIGRQIANTERVEAVIAERGPMARTLLETLVAMDGGPVPLTLVLEQAGHPWPKPSSRDYVRDSARIEGALIELESVLLAFHTYRRDGTRWLFVPYEILHPGEVATTLPLRQLHPLAETRAPVADPLPWYALPWDLLTVAREIAEHGAPVWVPGEPVSRPWQRRLNSRLWVSGEESPPTGYLGTLLSLGLAVAVLTPTDQPLPAGSERNAIRPVVGPGMREWVRLGFATQLQRLREAWLASEGWIEGREREEVEVWGADWSGFRHRLVDALTGLDPVPWFALDDLALWVAEQHPTLIGTTFTAASARSVPAGGDERLAATAQVVGIDLETALAWLGYVQVAPVSREGLAVRWRGNPVDEPGSGSALTVDEAGRITLLRPTALHAWSLSAFADLEALVPQARYLLRPGSVARALAAGFDLEQVTGYLESQGGAPLPGAVQEHLRQWTLGYRRVRMRRAVVLQPDAGDQVVELLAVLRAAGFDVLELPSPPGGLLVQLGPPEAGRDPEDLLLTTLRNHGFSGQPDGSQRPARR